MDSSKSLGFFGGYIFLARDWNLHVINSHVSGAIGWSFMRLDAAWHEWILVALAVVIDGMLAVCTVWVLSPFSSIFFYYALSGCFLWLSFFFVGLHPVCCMYCSFLTSILHTLLHGLPFVFCFLFLFYYYMVYILWGL